MRAALILLTTVVFAGCAGKLEYFSPNSQASVLTNFKFIEKPRDLVWNASVPEIGKQFFIINNLDKSSGLMNISYSGDPEKYVDCGRIVSYVKNARGERTYDFAAASAQQSYEIMLPNGLFFMERRMTLEGRINLIFEEMGPEKTKVTANTRYIISRNMTVRNVNNISQNISHNISLNSGGRSSFPAVTDGRATECMATGVLESEILSVIR